MINALDYAEFLAESLEPALDYAEYISDNLKKNVAYVEYVAQSIGNYGSAGISGTCGVSGVSGISGTCGFSGRPLQKEYEQKLPILKDLELIPYGQNRINPIKIQSSGLYGTFDKIVKLYE